MEKEILEQHNLGQGTLMRSIILGGQDGLVNVLGIILGVATATSSTNLVLLAGLAATFAESVSMGAVAYTSSKAELEHYQAELKREMQEIEELPEIERKEIEDIYIAKGFRGDLLKKVVDQICSDKKIWLEVMMEEELHLENPNKNLSSLKQAVIVGVSAIIGSFVPLTPFLFLPLQRAVPIALVASVLVLFLAGSYKSKITSGKWLRGGLEMAIIGSLAAFVGYAVGVVFKIPK